MNPTAQRHAESTALGVFSGQGGNEGVSIVSQLGVQGIGVLATVAYTAVATFLILKVVDLIIGNRVSEEEEVEGLDITQHNERGFDF